MSEGESFFGRFTDSARQVVVRAQEAARILRHGYIGVEHLLIALTQEEGLPAEVLASLGVSEDIVVAQVERIVGSGDKPVGGQIAFTPRAKRVLELASRESLSLGTREVGSEHILLGLIRENEGVAARILLDLDLDADTIRNEVIRALSASQRARSVKPGGASEDPEGEETSAANTTREETDPSEEELPSEPIPTHSDRPAASDELGRARLAEVLAERIRRIRGEDTELPVLSWRQRRHKRRRDRAASGRAGSFMVHLFAPWGAGKSSLLNFLADSLRNRGAKRSESRRERVLGFLRPRPTANPQLSRWIVVEFSAWEHQRLATPWWWLLAAVQRSCARELWQISRPRWLVFWARDLGWRVWNARAATFSALLLLGLLGIGWTNDWLGVKIDSLTALQTAALSVGAVIALGTTVAGLALGAGRWLAIGSAEGAVRFLRKAHDPLGVYHRRFRWLVRSAHYPITVFIDDLDRCRPGYVVELLEGIQTIFRGQPVTYVVAADRTWLYQSFSQGYEEFGDEIGELGRPLGILFLEKTFQISIEIPPMSAEDRERYWSRLIRGENETHPEDTEQSRERAREAFAGAETQEDVEERIDDLIESGAADDQVYSAAVRRLNAPDMQKRLEEQLANLLMDFVPLLENNPRSMKRLINAYGIERDRLLRGGRLLSPAERRILILLSLFRLRWPLFAEYLRSRPHEVALFEQDPPPEHPYAALFSDPDVRSLFDGSLIDEHLDAAAIIDFPGPAKTPSPQSERLP